MIPFIDLKAQYARLKPDIDRAIQGVLDDGRYVLGPAVKRFEAELADFVGCAEAVTVSSGTDALLIPLLAKGIGRGDAVFLPAFTYTATAEVIILVGATPVFVDVDECSFNIDVADLETKIAHVKCKTELRPAAIMPVDLFGQPADYSTINALADREGLFVVADAAQALGGSLGKRRVGALADCTGTSFYPSKPLGCYGDGGAILTNDSTFAEVLRSVRTHGQGQNKYDVVRLGLNCRLDSIQAAILSVKLANFENELERRDELARRYDAALAAHVEVPARVPNSRSSWAQYTIKTSNREGLQRSLSEAGIPSMVFYPKPLHHQPAYAKSALIAGPLPVSERICEQVLSLPMHAYLMDIIVDRICEVIRGHCAP